MNFQQENRRKQSFRIWLQMLSLSPAYTCGSCKRNRRTLHSGVDQTDLHPVVLLCSLSKSHYAWLNPFASGPILPFGLLGWNGDWSSNIWKKKETFHSFHHCFCQASVCASVSVELHVHVHWNRRLLLPALLLPPPVAGFRESDDSNCEWPEEYWKMWQYKLIVKTRRIVHDSDTDNPW